MRSTVYAGWGGEPDHEIIIKYKTDNYDWIDPIQEVWVEGDTLYVDNGRYIYDYKLSELVDYNIRPYDSENPFDYQGNNL